METVVLPTTRASGHTDTQRKEVFRAVKVLVVDDSPIFLAAATAFLSRYPQIQVVGRAQSGREAIQLVAEVSPDLVLMDVRMPQMNGLEATQRIKAQPAPPRVIILTLHDSPDCRESAQTVGADGFIAKDEFGDNLPSAIFSLFSFA